MQEVNRLLDDWQRLSGSTVTLEQRLLVAARLQQLDDADFSDQESAAAIAPLVAKQPSSLAQFKQFYQDDVARRRPVGADNHRVSNDHSRARKAAQDDEKGSRYLKYLLVFVGSCLTVMFLILVGYPLAISKFCGAEDSQASFCPPIVKTPIVDTNVQPIVEDTKKEPVTTSSYDTPVKVPVSLSSRKPAYHLSTSELPEVANTAWRNIAGVALGFGLVGFFLPLLTRLILRQTHSHWPTRKETLDRLVLDGLEPLHVNPTHHKLMPALRYHEAGPLRLDVDKSVVASGKRGLPQLKYGARLRRRDLMFVIPSFRPGDWRTDYFLSIADELRARDVQVHCFFYQHSPPFVTRTRSSLNSQPLARVLALFESATVVFCVNEFAVFHQEFGHRLGWTDALAWRDDRVLLADVPMSRPQSSALNDSKIHLVEFSDRAGPDHLLTFLADPESKDKPSVLSRTSYQLPESLAHLGDPASAHHTPESVEIKDLIRWLKSKLGKPAFELLCASAVYPDADWRLARLLAARLSDEAVTPLLVQAVPAPLQARALKQQGSGYFRRFRRQLSTKTHADTSTPVVKKTELSKGSLTVFRRLAQLPWSQQGRYPLWLRSALVEELGVDNESRVSDVYRQILERTGRGDAVTHYALTVDKPERGLSAWWRYFTHATPGQDVLFVSVVSRGLLGFRLPAAVSRLFRKSMLTLGHYWPGVVLGSLAALSAGALSWILYSQFTEQLEPDYRTRQAVALYRAQNAEFNVRIDYSEVETDNLSAAFESQSRRPASVEGLVRLLQSQGFEVSLQPRSAFTWTQNRVSAPPELLDRLVNIVTYHTYGLPPKPNVLTVRSIPRSENDPDAVISWVNQVQSGQIFRDDLDQSDTVNIDQSNQKAQPVTVAALDESMEDPMEEEGAEPISAATAASVIEPDMVVIPAGIFTMGSESSGRDDERPEHRVTLPSFEMARNELTWGEWQLCEDDGGCTEVERPPFYVELNATELSKHPVVNVNIAAVNDYLRWINEKTGNTYRLPSEAEWEYAARAGTTTDYFWGDDIGENRANCDGCGSAWDNQSTAPVGSFAENEFGLNDLHGNVWEWVADCWHDTYEGAPSDGSAWLNSCTDETSSPVRGGSWDDGPEFLRAAYRNWVSTDSANFDVGFRLARTLP